MSSISRNALAWIDEALGSLEREDLRRRLRTRESSQAARLAVDGRELMNFGSNDYLALAADPRVVTAVAEAAATGGFGSGASPLVVGRDAMHARLETALAQFEGTEAALLFSSGFAANSGTVAALVGPGDAIFTDEKNHASLIDGCRLSRAAVHVYRHGDVDHLRELLGSATDVQRRLLLTDSLFSMDGDLAPLADLADLADEFQAMLLVDEAHATGVFGEQGRGVAEYFGVESRVDIKVGTLSKAFGGAGGFVCGSQALIDWLSNRARSYVFSTASPAVLAAAALAALEVVQQEPTRRRTLLARAARFREELQRQGWDTGASASQIIPLRIGDPAMVMRYSQALTERGFYVPGIRPPSVPAGESLLRLSLRSDHSDEELGELLTALDDCRTSNV